MNRYIAVSLLLLFGGFPVQSKASSEAERAQQEQALREQLRAVRDQHRELKAERGSAEQVYNDLQINLRRDELRLAELAQELVGADAEILIKQKQLNEQQKKSDLAEQKISEQKEMLAKLIRGLYPLARYGQLRFLFAPESLEQVMRAGAYYRYLQIKRQESISALIKQFEVLEKAKQQLELMHIQLIQTQLEKKIRLATINVARQARAKTMVEIKKRLEKQEEQVKLLQKNEQELLALISQIRNAIADIPTQLANKDQFSQLRGRLSWPVTGAIKLRFGALSAAGRTTHGIVIAAPVGEKIKAVAHGRVAYADWLKGYGLIVIIEHGKGYMTLYAHNQSLLKEVGDWVNSGDFVATIGDSGGQAQTGLYFEIRADGKPVNPLLWLTQKR